MAHGLGGQKDFGLDRYGQMFSKEGIAVFIFDYRTFGGSSGEPRHWVSPKRHVQDWHSAVAYIQSALSDKVDSQKIILWGTSLAGGHALVTAGNLTDQIAGVIAQASLESCKELHNLPVPELFLQPCSSIAEVHSCACDCNMHAPDYKNLAAYCKHLLWLQ
jgi:alpha-beta hydrolase superfamily lysophospholipase